MYCLKCKKERDDKNFYELRMRNGKTAYKGKCPVCLTMMFIIPKQ